MTENSVVIGKGHLRCIVVAILWVAICITFLAGVTAYDRFHPRYQSKRVADFHGMVNRLMADGKYEDAIATCKKRIEDNPKDAAAHWFLGQSYYNQERWAESAAAMKRSLELNPAGERHTRPYVEAAEAKIAAARE